MIRAAVVALTGFVPMLAEARRSWRQEAALRAQGAIEPAGDVYPLMQVAYPASFAAIAVEAYVRDAPLDATFASGVIVFTLAKAVKYWAIATLGPRWTFRVLVPPGRPLVTTGPYRFMRHPNYLGVVGEVAGAALMGGAPVAGALAVLGFCGLLAARIRVEERAHGGV